MTKFHQKNLRTTQKEIFSFCFNVFVVILSIVGIVFLFTVPIARESGTTVANLTTFWYFTTDSNILIMFASLICCICLLLFWCSKIKQIPLWVYVLKHTATLTVSITMLITLFVLLPGSIITKVYPAQSLYMGSNLFFHLLNPLVALVSYFLFENKKDMSIKHIFWSLIPFVIYCVFYLAMAYTHMNTDGTFQKGYDWYKFCSFGIPTTIGILLALFAIYTGLAWLIWFLNKKIDLKSLKSK